MGLDMYLEGEKYFWASVGAPDKQRREDELRIKSLRVDLGYWRKHPNLHGFIVEAFAGGKDDCREIELSAVCLRNIISAIEGKRLPETAGFFFGQSRDDYRERDLEIFRRALAWLEADQAEKPSLGVEVPIGDLTGRAGGLTLRQVKVPKVMPDESRSVYYRASW